MSGSFLCSLGLLPFVSYRFVLNSLWSQPPLNTNFTVFYLSMILFFLPDSLFLCEPKNIKVTWVFDVCGEILSSRPKSHLVIDVEGRSRVSHRETAFKSFEDLCSVYFLFGVQLILLWSFKSGLECNPGRRQEKKTKTFFSLGFDNPFLLQTSIELNAIVVTVGSRYPHRPSRGFKGVLSQRGKNLFPL